MDHQPTSPFEGLAPVSDRYASLPVAEAFDWSACAGEVDPGEWYMVAFRSIRRPGVDEERLTQYDDWAQAEAMQAPGFVHYFKGPTTADGRCMSFCLWDSRAEARAAAGRPLHVEAAALTHEAYAEYSLEFHRVRNGLFRLEIASTVVKRICRNVDDAHNEWASPTINLVTFRYKPHCSEGTDCPNICCNETITRGKYKASTLSTRVNAHA